MAKTETHFRKWWTRPPHPPDYIAAWSSEGEADAKATRSSTLDAYDLTPFEVSMIAHMLRGRGLRDEHRPDHRQAGPRMALRVPHEGHTAEKERTRLLRQMDTGAHVRKVELTVAEFLTGEWLPALEPTIRPGTFEQYRRSVNVYVVPRIGRIELQQLTPADIQRTMSSLVKDGRTQSDGGLATKTVRNHYGVIHKALDDGRHLRDRKLTPGVHRAPRRTLRFHGPMSTTW